MMFALVQQNLVSSVGIQSDSCVGMQSKQSFISYYQDHSALNSHGDYLAMEQNKKLSKFHGDNLLKW